MLADLVGAIRLPERAFARSSGTDVVVDLVVLRRRLPGAEPAGPAWEHVGPAPPPSRRSTARRRGAAGGQRVLRRPPRPSPRRPRCGTRHVPRPRADRHPERRPRRATPRRTRTTRRRRHRHAASASSPLRPSDAEAPRAGAAAHGRLRPHPRSGRQLRHQPPRRHRPAPGGTPVTYKPRVAKDKLRTGPARRPA
jgi:hypothetical protein